MTADQMLENLKKYGINSREEFYKVYQQSEELLDIGIFTKPMRGNDEKADHSDGDDGSTPANAY